MIGLVAIALLAASCGAPNPASVEDVSAATADPTQAVTSSDDVRRISVEEARVLVEGGGAVLYDTRSAESYGRGHAAGAISFPESEAAGRVGELPTDKSLIFY
jgi:hypothetical protein